MCLLSRLASREHTLNALQILVAFLLTILLAPYVVAQGGAPTHSGSPHFNMPPGSFALSRGARPGARFRRSPPLAAFVPALFDDFYSPDDISPTDGPGASPPPAFLLQAVRALSGSSGVGGLPENNREPSPPEPLMIELQGDHYVRVSSKAIDGEALPLTVSPNDTHVSSPQASTLDRNRFGKIVTPNSAMAADALAAGSSARDLPAVVLVFRDGHSEEVRDYTIADGFLYARSDYYTDGYWNKKIDLSSLSLSETLQANSLRNVKFVLPLAANEVVTRP